MSRARSNSGRTSQKVYPMSPLQLFRIDGGPPSRIHWLWPGYVPSGKLTLLDGDPDRGKSLITIDLAARFSRGRALPDGKDGNGIVRSLFLQAEDDANDTLRPRLEAANADFDNVFVLGRDGPLLGYIQLPQHLRKLERLIREGQVGCCRSVDCLPLKRDLRRPTTSRCAGSWVDWQRWRPAPAPPSSWFAT